jgi:isopentenyl-diphosphate delta-isomerase
MIPAARAFVALSPPLPCIDRDCGAGFVVALAQDCLLLQLARPGGPEPGRRGELTILAEGGRRYELPCVFAPAPTVALAGRGGDLAAVVTEPAAQSRLADLMTLVRKGQHIAICESMDVEASDRYTGFSDLTLVPQALPELAWHELDTRTSLLGRTFPLPILITGMTGGLARGAAINRRLARAAAAFGIPMGVGSQRVALENPEHADVFAVKRDCPGIFLIANIGIAQLRAGDAVDACERAVEMIDADALAIHVNVLQEVIQVEGDRDFRGLIDRVAAVTRRLPVPVLVKEVGGGIDPTTAARFVEAGVKAVDCGGKGGTSWSLIEGMRAQSPVTRAVAETFRDWGIPTAVAVATLRRSLPGLDLIATGGIRDGLSVAKAAALGARAAGVGLPMLRATLASLASGGDEPEEALETLAQGLRTAMLCSGARTLADLRQRLHITPEFRAAASRYGQPSGDQP